MKTYSFPSGPSIKVHIEGSGDTLSKVTLIPHNGFSCEMDERLSKTAQEFIINWLLSYSKGEEPKYDLPISLAHYPEFTQKVLRAMSSIPLGRVESYSGLAKIVNSPKAARAVGNICRDNLFPLFIPCHRVRCSDGTLGGFAFGLAMKEALLRFERAI